MIYELRKFLIFQDVRFTTLNGKSKIKPRSIFEVNRGQNEYLNFSIVFLRTHNLDLIEP